MDSKYKTAKARHGYLTVEPKPTGSELKDFYANKYFQESVSTSYSQQYTADEIAWFRGAAQLAEFVWEQHKGEFTGSFFDVGCGEGFFANYFHEKKWKVSCCDFSDHGIKTQNPAVVPCLEKGDIFQILERRIKERREQFDFINLSNVLEHVLDPEQLLIDLKTLLRSGGILRICVPNDYSRFQRLLLDRQLTKETWFTPPEHLNYFNFETFSPLVTSMGFKVTCLMGTFPIEFFLVNRHSNYWEDRSLGKQAHLSRVIIDNFMQAQGMAEFAAFYEACARLGVGRDIVGFLTHEG